MTSTSQGRISMDWQQRYLQALPTIFTLGLTFMLPWLARRSLAFRRAAQAYEKQVFEPVDGKKRKRYISLLQMWPLALELLVFGTAGYDWKQKWPVFDFFRHCIPYACLFLFFAIVTFFAFAYLFLGLNDTQTVRRALVPNSQKVTNIMTAYDTSHPIPGSRAVVFLILFGVVPASALVIACAYANQIFAITLIAIFGIPLAFASTRQPIMYSSKTSLRAHLLTFTLIILVTSLIIAVGVGIAILYMKFVGTQDKSLPSSSKNGQVFSLETDLVSAQLFAMLCTWMWSFNFTVPASLLCLLYRYDLSNAGMTDVTKEQAEAAIVLSASYSKQIQTAKRIGLQDHHRDEVGRVPVLVGAHPLQVAVASVPPTPTFNVAWYAMIAVQLIGVLISVSVPIDGTAALFPRSTTELPGHLPITSAIYCLIAYPILLGLVPLSTAVRSISAGEGLTVGLRRLWKYEEDWGCNKAHSTKRTASDDEKCRTEC